MKILFDFTQIPIQKTGIGVYAFNLISSLYKIDKENEYFVVVQKDEFSLNFISGPKFKLIKVKTKYFRNRFLRFVLEQIYIPILAIKHKIDLVHSFHYSFPIFIFSKRVITVPDMTLFKFPAYHIKPYVYYFRIFTLLASKLASKIITISNSSKTDIESTFTIRPNKIVVTHLSYDLPEKSSLKQKDFENMANKFGIGKEYFLYIGTIEPRKNLERLILAFEKFKENNKNVQLVIVGKKGWHVRKLLEKIQVFKNGIILTGFVDKNDKAVLLSKAKLFIYPSIYEGFGIPVLEALSYGIPTITSNTSSFKEITNGAAILIDPFNTNEIYEAMKNITNDNYLYDSLRQKSLKQANNFSWRKTAEETLNVYNSILRTLN